MQMKCVKIYELKENQIYDPLDFAKFRGKYDPSKKNNNNNNRRQDYILEHVESRTQYFRKSTSAGNFG